MSCSQAFLINVNNLPEIDHISRDKSDNRVQNLRWCSKIENMKNREGYGEFIDDLPNDCIPFTKYNGHQFENYFINEVTK